MPDNKFASVEVAVFWQYISASIDRMIALLAGLSPEQLAWKPPASKANGLGVLAVPPEALLAPHHHPRRGWSTGREILLIVARHAAEHLGQAELTRDLLLAQMTMPR